MSDVHPVDSKKTQLSVTDIAAVAAHTDVPMKARFRTAAKKSGATPERITYSYFMQQMQDPSLIRIREGNTLFTIKAVSENGGVLRVYDGDVKGNHLANYQMAMDAAYKMGFDYVVAQATDKQVCQSLKVLSQQSGSKFKLGQSPRKDAVVMTLGAMRKGAA